MTDPAAIARIITHDVPIIISVASGLAALLPAGTPGTVWNTIRQVIDVLSLSFGKSGTAINGDPSDPANPPIDHSPY